MGDDAEERLVRLGGGMDVPLFVRPDFGGPPIAASAPGAIGLLYCVSLALEKEGSEVWAFLLHRKMQRGTAAAQGYRVSCLRGLWSCGGDDKTLYGEAVWAMRIAQPCTSYMLFADERGDAGEGYVEAKRLGQLWGEEAELNFAAVAGFSVDEEADDSG